MAAQVQSQGYHATEDGALQEIKTGMSEIGAAYKTLFDQAGQLSAPGRQEKFVLELSMVFCSARLLGYEMRMGRRESIDIRNTSQIVSSTSDCGHEVPAPCAGLRAIALVGFPDTTMHAQIEVYYCNEQFNYEKDALNAAASSGFELGLDEAQLAKVVFATCDAPGRGGMKKKGGRKLKIMRGGMSEETKLNLLTTAIIMGTGYTAYTIGVGGALLTGLDFCYRQGRKVMYAMNLLKRPCVDDAGIISGLILRAIPVLGQNALTCRDIAERNHVMNMALMAIVSTIYTTAIAIGLKTVTQQDLMSVPGACFSLVKNNVSRPILTVIQSFNEGGRGRELSVAAFQIVADGAGAVRTKATTAMAAMIAKALSVCTKDHGRVQVEGAGDITITSDQAAIADTVVTAAAVQNALVTSAVAQSPPPATNIDGTPSQGDASTGTHSGRSAPGQDPVTLIDPSASAVAITAAAADITEEQKQALQQVLDGMNQATKTAFANAVRSAVAARQQLQQQQGRGGRRKRNTRKAGHKKKRKTGHKKRKTVHKKKTKGRKVKRKTRGRKAKRGTRKYKR